MFLLHKVGESLAICPYLFRLRKKRKKRKQVVLSISPAQTRRFQATKRFNLGARNSEQKLGKPIPLPLLFHEYQNPSKLRNIHHFATSAFETDFLFLKNIFLNLSEHIQVVRNISSDFQSGKGCQRKQTGRKCMPKLCQPAGLHLFLLCGKLVGRLPGEHSA